MRRSPINKLVAVITGSKKQSSVLRSDKINEPSCRNEETNNGSRDLFVDRKPFRNKLGWLRLDTSLARTVFQSSQEPV